MKIQASINGGHQVGLYKIYNRLSRKWFFGLSDKVSYFAQKLNSFPLFIVKADSKIMYVLMCELDVMYIA